MLVASDRLDRWLFLYGFAKNERDNLEDDELQDLKRLAQVYLQMRHDTMDSVVKAGELLEVTDGE